MKRINKENINSQSYWNKHASTHKFGLRQKEYLKLAGKGENIIDIGCGISAFPDKARENFKYSFGLDFSTETIKKASRKYPKVIYIFGDCTKSMIASKMFDVSVSGEVIEHLENPEDLIKEMARITKRRVIISTAKMEYNDPEHLWEFDEEYLKSMGEKYGKTTVHEIKSEWFPGRSYLFMIIDL